MAQAHTFKLRTSTPPTRPALSGGNSKRAGRPINKHGLPILPEPPAVKIYPDGREECNKKTKAGGKEYRSRKRSAYERQFDGEFGYHRCCVCRRYLRWQDVTFEHENGRHKARIDERLWILDPETGEPKPLNGVSHLLCNSERGSKRTPIWHGPMDGDGFFSDVNDDLILAEVD